jgi:hypothetical protein
MFILKSVEIQYKNPQTKRIDMNKQSERVQQDFEYEVIRLVKQK